MAGLLTYPGFMKPSHPSEGVTVAGISYNHHRKNDRASQQRALLRILTAFPFHCNAEIPLQYQFETKINDFIVLLHSGYCKISTNNNIYDFTGQAIRGACVT